MHFKPSALSFRNPSIWERKPTIYARKRGGAATYSKEDVIELQRALNIANRPTVPLVLDGDFVEKLASGKDSATMTQVKLFQSMNDLSPNGVVDAAFWTTLAAKVGAAAPAAPGTTPTLPAASTKSKFDWTIAADAAGFIGQYLAKPGLDRAAAAQAQIAAQQAAQLAALQQQQKQPDQGAKDNTLWWILGGVGGLVVIGGIGLTIWAVTRKN